MRYVSIAYPFARMARACKKAGQIKAGRRSRAFHEDDGGFSTAGMALALLLSLALVFTSVQVYRIQSACADVQNVADASALAAENQVASFYITAQVCDAVVLTLSLTGTLCMGAGVVAMCVPMAQPVGEKLISAARRILDARTRLSESVTKGLDRLQQLLPLFAAAQAARVAHANGTSTSNYLGIALLTPFEGEPISEVPSNEIDDFAQQSENRQKEIAEAATRAEDAAKKADACKQRAFEADCGANPNYCMYERAGKLAGMSGSSNPLFTSVDAWSFSVAMKRAKTYYPRRLSIEAPTGGSVEEQGSSVLREHFYRYACDEIARGYVHETATKFDAHFPLLPRNTSEMRNTVLYTQALYPITVSESGQHMMHAWAGCPVVQELGSVGTGSVQQCESEGMPTCAQCEFSASRVGRIAAATTSTQSGFEHYYRIVAEEAAAYQKAREEQEAASEEVRKPVDDLIAKMKEALAAAARDRIHVRPPGSIGAIAVVADVQGVSAGSLVPSSFVAGTGTLGPRAAIAAASLTEDNPSETANVITSLFDGFEAQFGAVGVLPQAAAGLWGRTLYAYLEGNNAIQQGIKQALDALPLIGKSGLGTWAANKIQGMVADAGLEPVELAAYKPVLVNTYHVASADSGPVSQGIISAKQAYSSALGSGTGNPLAVVVGAAGSKMQQTIAGYEDGIVIAQVQLLGPSGPAIDVRIPLPPAVSSGAQGLIGSAVSAIQGLMNAGSAVRPWE